MALFNSFTFDGENSLDHGIFITGEAVYNAPERVIDMISVPGRNGDLAMDQGRFENIQIKYPAGCFADDAEGFARKIATFRNVLASRYSYKRLTDEYNPDEYRLALYKSGLEVEPVLTHQAGEFEIEFECKPQRWLISGETIHTFTGSGSLTNPTEFEARPLISVTGYGTLMIGDRSVIIAGRAGQVINIDCEIMEAWEMNGSAIIPRNDYVQYVGNEFPLLMPGTNGISKSGNISKIQITPRWWRV